MSDFTFLPPRPVRQADAVLFQTFDCGVQSLNGWLVRKALYNEIHGGSRTYVLSTSDGELAGFFHESRTSKARPGRGTDTVGHSALKLAASGTTRRIGI